jgi:cytochrome P450
VAVETPSAPAQTSVLAGPRQVPQSALPPGPKGPAAVNLSQWVARPAPFMERCRRRYGKRFSVDMGFEGWWVFLSDPDEIKTVFTAPADVVHPGEGSRVLEPVVGARSVLLLDGADHLAQRKLMLPAFHGERMRAITDAMSEVARADVERWPTGDTVALHGRLQGLTLDIILRAVFGLESGARRDALHEGLTEVLERGATPLSLLPVMRRDFGGVSPWARFQVALARTDALIEEVVADAGSDSDDVLSMFLSAGLEGQDLRDALMTLLVAGHETTASALTWAMERLLREPELLERTVAAADADDDAWLDAVVFETLRRRPVLPVAMPRRLVQDFEMNGRTYPAGVALTACIYLVHHDPELYPEPYAFRPSRWEGVTPGTYTWIPFGGGVRRCIGAAFAQLEMRIVLRELLRTWTLEPARSGLEGTRRRSITLSPKHGTPVRLRAR